MEFMTLPRLPAWVSVKPKGSVETLKRTVRVSENGERLAGTKTTRFYGATK